MKLPVFAFALVLCLCGLSRAQEQPAPVPDAPRPWTGAIVGTVVDVNDDTIPGASVVLQSPNLSSPRATVSNDNGFFQFGNLEPDTYRVTISAQGFANWTSDVIVKTSQYVILRVPKLQIAQALTTINVASAAASPQEIAAEQVKQEEQQRIFGIIPNFYVAYDQCCATYSETEVPARRQSSFRSHHFYRRRFGCGQRTGGKQSQLSAGCEGLC